MLKMLNDEKGRERGEGRSSKEKREGSEGRRREGILKGAARVNACQRWSTHVSVGQRKSVWVNTSQRGSMRVNVS